MPLSRAVNNADKVVVMVDICGGEEEKRAQRGLARHLGREADSEGRLRPPAAFDLHVKKLL